MPRLGPTLLSTALAGVITLAARTDVWLVGAAVLLVQVLVAAAPGLLAASGEVVASPRLVPALAAGLVATALTLEPDLLTGADGSSADVVGASDTGTFAGVLPAVAVGLFVALVAQMLRKDGRGHLVLSLGHAVLLGVAAALAVGWVGAVQSVGDWPCVAVGAAGLSAGLLAWTLPVDRWLGLGLVVLAGAGGGALVAGTVDSVVTPYFGVLVGSAAALSAVLGQVVARAMTGEGSHPAVAWGFPGALAVAMAAPVVYLGGQLVTAA